MAKQNRMALVEEPSRLTGGPDNYVSAPSIGHKPPEYDVIGGYGHVLHVRQPVNTIGARLGGPGMHQASQIGRTWNAGDTLHSPRHQGSAYPLGGGPVKMPLPAYSATVMMSEPPPQNRAAFSAAVTRFLATRGNRATGGG